MKQRLWILPMLIVLLASMAAASTITVTMNEPTTGTTLNNAPANVQTIDLNFTVVDDNSALTGMWVECYYYNVRGAFGRNGTKIIDWNGNDTSNSDYSCIGGSDWTSPGKDCTYKWTIPNNNTMPGASYFIDCNAVEWWEVGVSPGTYNDGNVLGDTNGTITLTMTTKLGNTEATRALMNNAMLIIAALALLAVLAIGVFVRPDPRTLAVMATAIAVAAAIGAMVIGVMVAAI